jgi:hypothetical protein
MVTCEYVDEPPVPIEAKKSWLFLWLTFTQTLNIEVGSLLSLLVCELQII